MGQVMKNQVSIEVRDKELVISCPYFRENVEGFRRFNGKWDKENKVWVLPDFTETRDFLRNRFNWVEGCESHTITIDYFSEDVREVDEYVAYKGYVLVSRKHCNYKAIIPDGVILAKGSLPASGGTSEAPKPAPQPDIRGRVSFLVTVFNGKVDGSPSKEAILNLTEDLIDTILASEYSAELKEEVKILLRIEEKFVDEIEKGE